MLNTFDTHSRARQTVSTIKRVYIIYRVYHEDPTYKIIFLYLFIIFDILQNIIIIGYCGTIKKNYKFFSFLKTKFENI